MRKNTAAAIATVPKPKKPAIDMGAFSGYIDSLDAELKRQKFATKGERTRFRLKVAALRALDETGFLELKVSDICKQADVALGTFYVYYQDKAEIAADVMLDFGVALYAQAHQAARGSSDYAAILVTNQFFVAAYRLNAGLVRCLIQLEDHVPTFRVKWREERLHWIDRLASSISRRSGHSETPKDVCLQIACALEGMVFKYLYDLFVRQEPILNQNAGRPEHIADLLSVLWYRAVYCEDPPHDQVAFARAALALHRDRVSPIPPRATAASAK